MKNKITKGKLTKGHFPSNGEQGLPPSQNSSLTTKYILTDTSYM